MDAKMILVKPISKIFISNWKECSFVQVPICRIIVLSLFQIIDWWMSAESMEFQILKSGLSWRTWSCRKENSKGHPWVYEANIGWQVSGIHSCEELVCQLVARKFWDQDAAESGRPSLVPTPQIVNHNFGQSTSLNQKNCWGTRNIHKTHWVYNSEYLPMQILPAKPQLKFVKGDQKMFFQWSSNNLLEHSWTKMIWRPNKSLCSGSTSFQLKKFKSLKVNRKVMVPLE